jgi:hypothetical protein
MPSRGDRPHLTLVPPATADGVRQRGSDWQESAERAIADLDSALGNYSDSSLMPRELLLTLRRQLAEQAGMPALRRFDLSDRPTR